MSVCIDRHDALPTIVGKQTIVGVSDFVIRDQQFACLLPIAWAEAIAHFHRARMKLVSSDLAANFRAIIKAEKEFCLRAGQ